LAFEGTLHFLSLGGSCLRRMLLREAGHEFAVELGWDCPVLNAER
jgi:hypothetical protein